MILLADGGATSTTWCAEGRRLVTAGMNPQATTAAELAACAQAARAWLGKPPTEIVFYGAGCGNVAGSQRVRDALAAQFPGSRIAVETDLLGACRASCGSGTGRVGILGTGSNACYYNGIEPVTPAPSLGYLLGDEGGGNYIGKRLLKDYFRKEMPAEVRRRFQKAYNMDYAAVMECIYRHANPSAFLGGFATFAVSHMSIPYVRAVCRESFEDYLDTQVRAVRHVRTPLHLVGGLAHAMAPVAREVCAERRIPLGNILRDPMDGLETYHKIS